MKKNQKKGEQDLKEKKSSKKITDEEKIKMLLEGSYISDEDLKMAEDNSKIINISIIDYLLSKNIITGDLLGQAVAEHFNIPYADLNTNIPTSEDVVKIPAEIAEEYRVVFFNEDNNNVIVTTDNPEQKGLLSIIKKVLKNKKITIAYSLPEDIDSILIDYRKPLKTRFTEIIAQNKEVAPNIIQEIIDDALAYRASDIHFEPQQEEVLVRFRVDGVLRAAGRVPLNYYDSILNRIKVQASMRIDQHANAQDGSIHLNMGKGEIDMRISIIPTIMGEKIVIRLLARYVGNFSLGRLGLSKYNEQALIAAAHKPFGMILVTGPTGSGKSTTLYSLLRILNRPGINITTIEDPVEFRISGVNQIQVNKATDLTFSRGLRAIVRQDPDIILVGEIRGRETSEIAVNAALTGHLLLSTFHANDAETTVPRLLDMGIEPFLLASTIELVIAQRLVRRICDHCRYSEEISRKELAKKYPGVEKHFSKSTVTLYKGKGCETCNYSGYDGRIAIFEFITMNDDIKNLISKRPSAREILALAKKAGARSLFDDGLDKVKNGLTTLEELLRVANQD